MEYRIKQRIAEELNKQLHSCSGIEGLPTVSVGSHLNLYINGKSCAGFLNCDPERFMLFYNEDTADELVASGLLEEFYLKGKELLEQAQEPREACAELIDCVQEFIEDAKNNIATGRIDLLKEHLEDIELAVGEISSEQSVDEEE